MPLDFKSMEDTLKNLKRGKGKYKFCPVCGNPDLELSSSLDLWLTPPQYVCSKCGYKGPLFMEREEEKEKPD